MVRSRSKASVVSPERLNVDTRLKNAKFALWLQSYFIRKKTQFLILSKIVNGLSTIFWVIEYWYKAQECKTWSANTKPLCWQSNVKLEVSKKVSLHIRVFYWKSRKAWIFWAIKYLYKAKKQQIWSTNAKEFFWKGEASLENFKQRSPYIENSYKLVLKSVKSLNWIFWAIQYWLRAL